MAVRRARETHGCRRISSQVWSKTMSVALCATTSTWLLRVGLPSPRADSTCRESMRLYAGHYSSECADLDSPGGQSKTYVPESKAVAETPHSSGRLAYHVALDPYHDFGFVSPRTLSQFTENRLSASFYTFFSPILRSPTLYALVVPRYPGRTQSLHTISRHRTMIKLILILVYAQHRNPFVLRVEDAETSGNDWDEVLQDERINRAFSSSSLTHVLGQILPSHLSLIIAAMVEENAVAYELSKQARSVPLHWRLPEEWPLVIFVDMQVPLPWWGRFRCPVLHHGHPPVGWTEMYVSEIYTPKVVRSGSLAGDVIS